MLQDKFILGHLKNKLLNISTEIETRVPLASNILKKIISGELIQADQKFNKNPVIFKPIAKHIFSMNEIPIITDKSWGFERRLIVIKFNQRFEGINEDKFLDKKLEEEISGIFNWMLLGLKRVLDTGNISESEQMIRDRKNFLKSINPVSYFFDEQIDFEPTAMIEKTDLYKAYASWCDESGVRKLSKIRFYAQVLCDYQTVEEKQGRDNQPRVFKGIALKFISSTGSTGYSY
jgi:putative DNA primase/helicase